MLKKGILFLIIIFPFSLFAQSKKSTNTYYLAIHPQLGKVIPNNPQLSYLWNGLMYGVDMQLGKNTDGEKEWEQWFNYPDYGLAFRYLSFDYEPFGSTFAFYIFINGRFFRHNFFSLRYSLGAGLMFWPKHYHKEYNPDNFFIGSYINAHIDLSLGADFQLSKTTDLFIKAAFSHSSNGAIVLPNRGVNAISGHLGFRYHFQEEREYIYTLDSLNVFEPENTLYLFIAPGFRMSKHDGMYYYKQGIQLGYARHFHPKYRYGAGIDVNFSGDLKPMLSAEEQNPFKYWSVGTFASFDIKYGRFMLHMALGVYTFKYFRYYTTLYERVGFRYFLGDQENHFVGIAIKAHGGTADFIEWTYGFNLHNWLDKKTKELKIKHREI